MKHKELLEKAYKDQDIQILVQATLHHQFDMFLKGIEGNASLTKQSKVELLSAIHDQICSASITKSDGKNTFEEDYTKSTAKKLSVEDKDIELEKKLNKLHDKKSITDKDIESLIEEIKKYSGRNSTLKNIKLLISEHTPAAQKKLIKEYFSK